MTKLIGAYPYEQTRDSCHRIKQGDAASIDAWARTLAAQTPPRTLLIPVPGHTGLATYTASLAGAIARMAAQLEVKDVIAKDLLKGKERPSLCDLKHEGTPVTDTDLGISWKSLHAKAQYRRLAAEGYRPVLVDNVIDTGYTLRHCLELIPEAGAAVIGITGCPLRAAYLPDLEYPERD